MFYQLIVTFKNTVTLCNIKLRLYLMFSIVILASSFFTAYAQDDVVDFGDSGEVVVVHANQGIQTSLVYVFYDEFFEDINPWRFLPGVPFPPPFPSPTPTPSPDPEIDCAALWQGITDALNAINQIQDLIDTLSNGDLFVGISDPEVEGVEYERHKAGSLEHFKRYNEALQDLEAAENSLNEQLNNLPGECTE